MRVADMSHAGQVNGRKGVRSSRRRSGRPWRVVPVLVSLLAWHSGCRCNDSASSASSVSRSTPTATPAVEGTPPPVEAERTDVANHQPAEGAGFEPATSGSTLPLPDEPLLRVVISLDQLRIGEAMSLPLAQGRLPPDSPSDAVEQSLAGGDSPTSGAPTAVVLDVDRRVPVGTVYRVLTALAGTPREIALGAVNRAGDPVRLAIRRPDEAADWSAVEALARRESEGRAGLEDVPRQVGAVRADPDGDGLIEIPPEPIPVPDWRRVPVRLSAHTRGVWFVAGRRGLAVPGFFAADVPRDDGHPNVPAVTVWDDGSDASTWLDWSGLQDQLAQLGMVLLDQRLVPDVEVSVAPELPFEILVRLVDALQHRLPEASGGEPLPHPRLLLPPG